MTRKEKKKALNIRIHTEAIGYVQVALKRASLLDNKENYNYRDAIIKAVVEIQNEITDKIKKNPQESNIQERIFYTFQTILEISIKEANKPIAKEQIQ